MIPVGIGGKTGLIEAAVIKGQAPLLLGRPTLQRLGMHLDLNEGVLSVLNGAVKVKMHCNPSGQVLLNLVEFPAPDAQVPTPLQPTTSGLTGNMGVADNVGEKQNGSPKTLERRKVIPLRTKNADACLPK